MDSVREGQVLAGKYRVERVIGQGGMGIVVAAIHQQLEQRVALKFLLPEGTADLDNRARFLREARAAVRLKSEHVARVLDVGTLDEGAPYIVMEFLEGRDLDGLLEERGKLPVALAVDYLLQACEAIAEAHAMGIVHRDLKPANLFLTTRNDGSPCIKVLDFGISKVTSPDSATGMTQNAVMLGTPHYMSPEQLRSSRDVDVRSDIWSLGMILHELLTGVVAYRRETLPDLCAAILTEPVPPLRSQDPSLPVEIERVVGRALAKQVAERYQSLAELARDLAPFVPRGEVAARQIESILGRSTAVLLPARPLPPPVPSQAFSGDPTIEASTPLSSTFAAPAPSSGEPVATALPLPSAALTLPTQPAPSLPRVPLLPARSGLLLSVAVAALCGLALLFWRSSSSPDLRTAASSPSPSAATSVDAPARASVEVVLAPASSSAVPVVTIVSAAPAAPSAPSASTPRARTSAEASRPPSARPGKIGLSSDFGSRK